METARINRFVYHSFWKVSFVNKCHHITLTNEWQILRIFFFVHHKSSTHKRRLSFQFKRCLSLLLDVLLKSGNKYEKLSIELRSNKNDRWHSEKETIPNDNMKSNRVFFLNPVGNKKRHGRWYTNNEATQTMDAGEGGRGAEGFWKEQ